MNILACGHYFLHVLSYHVELALINAGNNSSTYSALDNSMLLFNPHVARVIIALLLFFFFFFFFFFILYFWVPWSWINIILNFTVCLSLSTPHNELLKTDFLECIQNHWKCIYFLVPNPIIGALKTIVNNSF